MKFFATCVLLAAISVAGVIYVGPMVFGEPDTPASKPSSSKKTAKNNATEKPGGSETTTTGPGAS